MLPTVVLNKEPLTSDIFGLGLLETQITVAMLNFFTLLSFWDWLDVVGLALVFLGVAGEIIFSRIKFPASPIKTKTEDVEEAEPLLAAWRSEKEMWSAKMRSLEHWSEIVLVVGIALELIALPHHFIEAGQANERAAKLEARASSNEVKRVELELELEKLKAPRTITEEQRERFISAAKKLPKGPIKFGVRNPDIETTSYTAEILNLVTNAGYEISSAMNYPDQITGTLADNSTIIIAFDSAATAPTHWAGLLMAFNESGISVAKGFNPTNGVNKMPVGTNEVLIWILEKRPPRPIKTVK